MAARAIAERTCSGTVGIHGAFPAAPGRRVALLTRRAVVHVVALSTDSTRAGVSDADAVQRCVGAALSTVMRDALAGLAGTAVDGRDTLKAAMRHRVASSIGSKALRVAQALDTGAGVDVAHDGAEAATAAARWARVECSRVIRAAVVRAPPEAEVDGGARRQQQRRHPGTHPAHRPSLSRRASSRANPRGYCCR
jgi:hypothetical protein